MQALPETFTFWVFVSFRQFLSLSLWNKHITFKSESEHSNNILKSESEDWNDILIEAEERCFST